MILSILTEISGRIEQQIHLIGYTTEQSSDNGGASSLAVDRNINTASQCTQTTQETDPWWSVDMQLNEAVTKVEIYFKQSMSGRYSLVATCGLDVNGFQTPEPMWQMVVAYGCLDV